MTDQRQMPLRRVVEHGQNALGTKTETLECGHTRRVFRQIYNRTSATRRRCRQCFNDAKGAR